MGIIEILLIVLVLAAILLGLALVIWVVIRAARPAGSQSPLDVLRRRLAAGEITADEFDVLRKKLED